MCKSDDAYDPEWLDTTCQNECYGTKKTCEDDTTCSDMTKCSTKWADMLQVHQIEDHYAMEGIEITRNCAEDCDAPYSSNPSKGWLDKNKANGALKGGLKGLAQLEAITGFNIRSLYLENPANTLAPTLADPSRSHRWMLGALCHKTVDEKAQEKNQPDLCIPSYITGKFREDKHKSHISCTKCVYMWCVLQQALAVNIEDKLLGPDYPDYSHPSRTSYNRRQLILISGAPTPSRIADDITERSVKMVQGPCGFEPKVVNEAGNCVRCTGKGKDDPCGNTQNYNGWNMFGTRKNAVHPYTAIQIMGSMYSRVNDPEGKDALGSFPKRGPVFPHCLDSVGKGEEVGNMNPDYLTVSLLKRVRQFGSKFAYGEKLAQMLAFGCTWLQKGDVTDIRDKAQGVWCTPGEGSASDMFQCHSKPMACPAVTLARVLCEGCSWKGSGGGPDENWGRIAKGVYGGVESKVGYPAASHTCWDTDSANGLGTQKHPDTKGELSAKTVFLEPNAPSTLVQEIEEGREALIHLKNVREETEEARIKLQGFKFNLDAKEKEAQVLRQQLPTACEIYNKKKEQQGEAYKQVAKVLALAKAQFSMAKQDLENWKKYLVAMVASIRSKSVTLQPGPQKTDEHQQEQCFCGKKWEAEREPAPPPDEAAKAIEKPVDRENVDPEMALLKKMLETTIPEANRKLNQTLADDQALKEEHEAKDYFIRSKYCALGPYVKGNDGEYNNVAYSGGAEYLAKDQAKAKCFAPSRVSVAEMTIPALEDSLDRQRRMAETVKDLEEKLEEMESVLERCSEKLFKLQVHQDDAATRDLMLKQAEGFDKERADLNMRRDKLKVVVAEVMNWEDELWRQEEHFQEMTNCWMGPLDKAWEAFLGTFRGNYEIGEPLDDNAHRYCLSDRLRRMVSFDVLEKPGDAVTVFKPSKDEGGKVVAQTRGAGKKKKKKNMDLDMDLEEEGKGAMIKHNDENLSHDERMAVCHEVVLTLEGKDTEDEGEEEADGQANKVFGKEDSDE